MPTATQQAMLKVRSLVFTVLLMAALTSTVAAPSAAATSQTDAVPPATVVSISMDDGLADELTAATILERNGMAGTFYVNTGSIDTPGHFTRADLDQLAAAGQEIGGHTVLHPDLTAISPNEAVREICIDRQNLINWGFHPTSFAYPYGAYTHQLEAIAAQCGYNGAREVGDLASRSAACRSCAVAETIPPADRYAIRTGDDIDPTWSLSDIEAQVLAAERAGGGWVPLVFHSICDGCSSIGVNPATFAAFVAWLHERQGQGTVVRTVGDILGGPERPVPPVSFGGLDAKIVNPAFAGPGPTGIPACWTLANYGKNNVSASALPAPDGRSAVRVDMQHYSNGDGKLLPTLDLGQCAPPATADTHYQVSMWYRSNVPVQFSLYTRNRIGQWSYWTASPFFAPSPSWTQASWTTPTTPGDTTALSFGMSITSNGYVATDNYTLAAAQPSILDSRGNAIAWAAGAIVLAVFTLWLLSDTLRYLTRKLRLRRIYPAPARIKCVALNENAESDAVDNASLLDDWTASR